MLKKILLVLVAAAILLGPAVTLMGIAVLANPAASASCLVTGSVSVGAVPDSLTATTANGEQVSLNKVQLTHAATIISVGDQTNGVGRDGIVVALMAALTESTLRQLSNTSAYPESAGYPNDGDGDDHDSLGLFQMRPAAGWGTVAELMDPAYQAHAFYGGPAGPNHGSPRGLLDFPAWQQMSPGQAAQAVEVSAYPDRYANYQPVAEAILTALTTTTGNGAGAGSGGSTVPETSRIVFPLPDGVWTQTSPFGPRTDPITGASSFHTGNDYAAPGGTPIYAVADGQVVYAGMDGDLGLIRILHTIGGQPVATVYMHMWADGIGVHVGQSVTAGQQIGQVGSSGHSTGNHLHLEVHPGGATAPPIDPVPWLAQHGASPDGQSDAVAGNGCDTTTSGPATPYDGTNPDAHVPDPTGTGTGGFVTERMANLIAQARAAFPDTGWSCWSPRPGQVSEHSLGRACDVTFGNRIGSLPTSIQLAAGWALTNWLKTNAQVLGVEYLIWQGKIWSVARDAEGWRPYDGGGMHDPASITGGHYDHAHISVI